MGGILEEKEAKRGLFFLCHHCKFTQGTFAVTGAVPLILAVLVFGLGLNPDIFHQDIYSHCSVFHNEIKHCFLPHMLF